VEIWVHAYVDVHGNIILPRHNFGPHYNKQRYGRKNIEKGKQVYESKKDVLAFLKYHYPGRIGANRDDVVVWLFNDSLPEDVKHCAMSVFTKFELNIGERGLEIKSPTFVDLVEGMACSLSSEKNE